MLPTLTLAVTATATSIWVSLLIRPDAAAQVATGGGGGDGSVGCMQNAPRRKVQRVNQNVIKSFGKSEKEREGERKRPGPRTL